MSKEIVYRVLYHQQDVPYELYARSVSESDMFGFVELDELVLDGFVGVLGDETHDKIKLEFEAVKRTYIPLCNVFRIDAIERDDELTHKRTGMSNVTVFPTSGGGAKGPAVKPNTE